MRQIEICNKSNYDILDVILNDSTELFGYILKKRTSSELKPQINSCLYLHLSNVNNIHDLFFLHRKSRFNILHEIL